MVTPNEQLIQLRKKSLEGGGIDKQAAQHEKGKLSARERIEYLLDPGSFVETDAFVTHDCKDFGMEKKKILGDGVITGWGMIDKRIVYIFSQDFTVFGGSLSMAMARKICKIMNLALKNGAPLIGLNDSGGARIHEGVASLGGYADIFYLNVQSSGVIPQLSVIMGPCAGGAVYSPAMTDFIFMVEGTSHMFITGPNVIKTVTGEDVTFEQLGGATTHSKESGVCDLHFVNELEALNGVKKWLTYVPDNNLAVPAKFPSPDLSTDPRVQSTLKGYGAKIENIVPLNPSSPYQVCDVIECVVDPDSLWEIKPNFAPNIFVGFARLGGMAVGVVGNNPAHTAGVLDIDASVKAARFIRFCDAFNLPILTFVDVPGFLPGSNQEKGGIIRHGAKLLYAYSEATVPLITVILRKAYGGAYDVMASKHIGADLNFAWPQAEIAVMGPDGACNIIFRKEIDAAPDPVLEQRRQIQNYKDTFANPYIAAEKGYIDAVILPSETRDIMLRGLATCIHKRKETPKRKHGNIPL